MKTKKSKKPIIIVISILAVVLIAATITLIYIYPLLTMTPIETGKIEDTGIIAIRNNSNDVFLFNSGDGYIMIDAGSDSSGFVASLSEISVNPDEIKHIFVTHTHYDHVAVLGICKNAQVYMSKNEQQMIDGTAGNNSLPSLNKPMLLLADGEKIEINGHTIECIDAPGHTTGSMVYLLDDKYLFTGDAFKISDGKIYLHPFTMDNVAAEATIDELEAVIDRSQYVFFAHYGYCKSDEISAEAIK